MQGSLQDESETVVLIDSYNNRNDKSCFVLRPGVEILGETGDVDAVRTKSGAYRGAGVAFPAGS